MSSESLEKGPQTKAQRYPLFHPAIAGPRKQYLKFYCIYVTLLILLMWALLPIFWASQSYGIQHTRNLRVWVVDRDQSTIGAGVLDAIHQADNNAAVTPTLGWILVPNNDSLVNSDAKVVDAVLNEMIWAVIVVNSNATQDLISAFSGNSAPLDRNASVSVYYNEARQEVAAGSYIIPIITGILTPTIENINTNLTSGFLAANANNQSAIESFARSTAAVAGVTLEMNNLRPFTSPVLITLTVVGITIFSFILTMANSALRPIVSPHLSLPSYIVLRIVAPLVVYIPLSLSFVTTSLPFHVPLHTKYTEAQGFFLFWLTCYILMGSLGLAMEFAIGLLTIRFTPFFFVTLMITNISIVEFPLELAPGIFHYGRGFPFYNAAQAFRTIAFDTKSHLSTNIPVLIGWLLLSSLTIGVSTWVIERRNRVKH